MEKQLLFCVYDSKVEGYLPPYSAQNRAVAYRIFESAIMQENHDFNQHAEDYALYEIGYYEPDSGELVSVNNSVVVAASHIVAKLQNQREDHERGV